MPKLREVLTGLSNEVLDSEIESLIIIAATNERSGMIRYNVCREHAAKLMNGLAEHMLAITDEEKKLWNMEAPPTKH